MLLCHTAIVSLQLNHFITDKAKPFKTRKLSYRKDDRAMRPMYGRPENFQEALTTHTATFPEFLMGFCSNSAHKCARKI